MVYTQRMPCSTVRLSGLDKALLWSALVHLVVLSAVFALSPERPPVSARAAERLVVREVTLAAPAEVPAPKPVDPTRPAPAQPTISASSPPPPAPRPVPPALEPPNYPRSRPRPAPATPAQPDLAATSAQPDPPLEPSSPAPTAPPEDEDSWWVPPADWRKTPVATETPAADRLPRGAGGGGGSAEAMPVSTPPIRVPSGYTSVEESLLVRFAVEPDGQVFVELVRGSGDARLDQLALETLRQWKWRPATRDGETVSSRVEVEVELLR